VVAVDGGSVYTTGDYTIPLTISRGFCSGPPRREIADRFEKSGKEKLVLILLTDHDPDGTAIAQSMAASMRDEFGIGFRRFHAERAALKHDQVKRLRLPPNSEKAKPTSSNYEKFVKQFGDDVYELEAVPPTALQQLLRDTIDGIIDHHAFQNEVSQERLDAAEIANVRARVMAAMPAKGS
jgi:hypothetical protein